MPLLSPAAILVDEIARIGSIRRAAERMNASASAVNRLLINLELELGAPLFERLPKGVRLTAAGEAIVQEVRRWRKDQERVQAFLHELKGLRRGHIAIGFMECMALDLAPRVIEQLQRLHPLVTLEAVFAGTEVLADRLAAGTLNAVAAFVLPSRAEFKVTHTTRTAVGAVVAPDHPLAQKASVQLSDCITYPFIIPDISLSIRMFLDSALSRVGTPHVVMVTSNSISFIKASLLSGIQVSLLGWLDVYREVAAGSLRFVPLLDRSFPDETLSIAIPLRARNSSLTALAASVLQQELSRVLDPASI